MLRELYYKLFKIDPRGLATYRIITGLLMSLDGILRLRNLEVFYLDSGAVPLSLAQETVNTSGPAFSFFFLSASDEYAALLFALYILLGVVVAVGYRSRASIVLAFLFAVSFDIRNPFVTSYADTLYRHLLFWAMFLPVGRRWSLDAAKGRATRPSFEPASALILLQVVAMYFISATYKLPKESWRTGKEVAMIMGRDSMAWLLGQHLTEFPSLLRVGGTTWVLLTITIPLVLFLPKKLRNLHVVMLIGCNVLLALTVRIGAFPFVSISGLILFLSTGFWDWIESTARAGRRRLIRSTPNTLEKRSAGHIAVCMVVLALGINSAEASLRDHTEVGDGESPRNGGELATSEISKMKAVFHLAEPSWKVFTSSNYSTDSYPVIIGTTKKGRIENHLVPNHTTLSRPSEDLNGVYRTYRHRFFFPPSSSNRMRSYMDYLCIENEYGYLSYFVVHEEFNITQINRPATRNSERLLVSAYNCQEDRMREPDVLGWRKFERFPLESRNQLIVERRQN